MAFRRMKKRLYGASLPVDYAGTNMSKAYAAGMLVGQQDVTWDVWVLVGSESKENVTHQIFAYWTFAGIQNGWMIAQYGSDLHLYLGVVAGLQFSASNFFANRFNRWVHLTVTAKWSTGAIAVYADGLLVSSGTHSGGAMAWNITDTNASMYIGSGVQVTMRKSQINRTRQWIGLAMSAAEVAALHYEDIDPDPTKKVIDVPIFETGAISTARQNLGTVGGEFTATATALVLNAPPSQERGTYRNIVSYSSDQTKWGSKLNLTAAAYGGALPAAISQATVLSDDAVNGSHYVRQDYAALTPAQMTSEPFNLPGVQQRMISFYGKSVAGSGWIDLECGGLVIYFDLINGVVGVISSVYQNAGMEDVGGGWWRCWATYYRASGAAEYVRLFLASANGVIVYAGPSQQVAVGGVQVEDSYVGTRPRALIETGSNPLGTSAFADSRQNFLSYSNDYAQAYWVKTGLTLDGMVTAPDGTNTATVLVDSVTAVKSLSATPKTTGALAVDKMERTFVVYAKAIGRTFFAMGVGPSTNCFQYFDLGNGYLGSRGGVAANIIGCTMESAGDGWYRCSITTTVPTGDFYIYLSNGNNGYSYVGDGRQCIAVWGAQVSATRGPSPLVHTTGSPAGNWVDLSTPAGAVGSPGGVTPRSEGMDERISYWGGTTWTNWTLVGVTLSDAGITTPFGHAAALMSETATVGTHRILFNYNPNIQKGSVVTSHFMLKRGTRRYGYLYGASINAGYNLSIDLDTGLPFSGALAIGRTWGVEPAGDGWWHVWISSDVPSDNASTYYIWMTPDGTTNNYAGDPNENMIVGETWVTNTYGPSSWREGYRWMNPYAGTPAQAEVPRGKMLVQNIIANSENIPLWTLSNTSAVLDATPGFDGATVTSLTASAINAPHYALQTPIGFLKQDIATLEIDAKYGLHTRYLMVQLNGSAWVVVDLTTGLLAYTGGNGYISHDIVSLGNGWYRIVLTGQAVDQTQFTIYTQETSGITTYLPTVGNYVLLSRAQMTKAGGQAPVYYETSPTTTIFGHSFTMNPSYGNAPRGKST